MIKFHLNCFGVLAFGVVELVRSASLESRLDRKPFPMAVSLWEVSYFSVEVKVPPTPKN